MKKRIFFTICLLLITALPGRAEGNYLNLRFFVPEPIAAFDRIKFHPTNGNLTPETACTEEGTISHAESTTDPDGTRLLICSPDPVLAANELRYVEDAWSYTFIPTTNTGVSTPNPDYFQVFPTQTLPPNDPAGPDAIRVSMHTDAIATGNVTEFKLTLEKDAGILSLGLLQNRPLKNAPQEYTTLPAEAPYEGAGTRLLWYPKKSALRAGQLTDSGGTAYPGDTENYWNDANIGLYSVAFGLNNLAQATGSMVFSGSDNRILSDQDYSVIAGGKFNKMDGDGAGGDSVNAAITGGHDNELRDASYSFIGGGTLNKILKGGHQAIIGGTSNRIPFDPIIDIQEPQPQDQLAYSFIGGGGYNSLRHYCASSCTTEHSLTIIGGEENNIVSHFNSAVAGLDTEGSNSFIGGGNLNSIVLSHNSLIIGGFDNRYNTSLAPPHGHHNIIAGGESNQINGSDHATILGGGGTTFGGNNFSNQINNQPFGMIVGGENNILGSTLLSAALPSYTTSDERRCVIIGGHANRASNLIDPAYTDGTSCFVGGGESNESHGGFVAGGHSNKSYAYQAGIGGGQNNRVGYFLWADPTIGEGSYIAGGEGNRVTGNHSWVGGKNMWLASDYSFLWGYSDIALDPAVDAPTVSGDDPKFIILGNQDAAPVRVGIRTLSPQQALDVNGDMRVQGQVFLASPGVMAGGTALEIDTNTGDVGFDLAEYFPGDHGELDPGTVVMIDDETGLLTRAAEPYNPKTIGIVSTRPAMVFEGDRVIMNPTADSLDPDANDVAVALKGRIPVKISLENGPIEPGDPLTSSSTPGYAMKATDAEKSWGTTIGKALEGFSGGPAGETEGTILAFVTLY